MNKRKSYSVDFKRLIIVVVALYLCPSLSLGQANITAAEYFIDADPGTGNGTAITGFSASETIDVSTFNIPTTSLALGRHTLCVRTKNVNNVWGYYECRAFIIGQSGGTVTPPPPITSITNAEYFIDTDPGPGNGTPITVTAATALDISTLNIPTTSLSTGWHLLGVRTRNANGTWGYYDVRRFYIQPLVTPPVTPAVSPIVAFEYSIDTDPGVGSGAFSIPITPATNTVDLINQNFNVGSLSLGSHKLIIRGKNQDNEWGFYEVRNFSVCNQPQTILGAATSVTTTGFTANWSAAAGATSYQLDVSKDNFATFVTGYTNKTIVALSEVITGLTSATAYQYRVRAVSSCASDYSTIATTTLLTIPTAQPSGLSFASTGNSLALTFSAASGPPSGYLAIRKVGISPAFIPVNNTAYAQGQIISDGTVAYVGVAPAFLDAGLSPDTDYYYDIFSYNQSGTLYSYLTSIAPLQGNRKTLATEPAAQPTGMSFSSITHTGLTVSFTAATGSPAGYLVLRNPNVAPISTPVDGTTYTTTAGTDVVAYQGASASFADTGLTQNTDYYYTIYAYNGTGTAINYRTVSPLQGNQLTPIAPPTATATNLVFSNVTPSSMTVSYVAPAGNPSGYLVVRKMESSPSFVPQSNTIYTSGQTLSDGVVAYVGAALTFNESGLTASTTYFYDVFVYNQNGSLISYQLPAPLEGSKSTFTAEPTAQPTAIVFSEVSATSIKVSFTAANPSSTGYLVLRRADAAPISLPADGTAYTTAQTIGEATVAFSGATSSFVDNGLLPGTTYYYQLFSYNGSDAATNYLTTVTTANAGSKITIPDKPILAAATLIRQNQFTVNWAAVKGAANYKIDVSKDNFQTMVVGFSDVTIAGLLAEVIGLEAGTAYKYRVRAANASGTSVNSEEGQQFTIPATPVLNVASDVTQIGFKANWTSVPGATGYFIDVSEKNDFTTFVVGYQNKTLGNSVSETFVTLTPGIVYYYRVRSVNIGGTSSSSDSKSQLLLPATPVGVDIPNPTSTSFKAKWLAVVSATEYRLDVSLANDNFTPSLPDYTNKAVIGNVEELVVNLLPNTAYRYRIRAVNTSGTSPNSIPISVSTNPPGSGVELDLANLLSSLNSTSIQVKGGNPPYTMSFYYRKITASDFTVRPLSSSSSAYQTAIDASMMDELGIEFYFKVTDANGTSKQSANAYVYQAITSNQKSIPTLSSGGLLKDYTIFSIPYALTDNNISNIFEELGKYEKYRWRLVRYQGGKNVDYTEGLTKIELGKGYWFNALDKTDVTISEGTTTQVNQTLPFKLKLEKDWNQVGDPFTFNIDWSDVLAANPSLSSKVDQTILSYDGATTSFKETDVLKAWGGGFVFANEAVELNLPVTLKNTSSGRKKSTQQIASSHLQEAEWFLPITLKHANAEHTYGGLGMHPEASESKDVFDKHTLPRFGNYLEWNTRHSEFFNPWFARDIVPTAQTHTWSFTAESNFEQGEAQLSWDNFSLGQNEAQLLLVDQSNQTMIDMKKHSNYKFDLKESKEFKIYYSADEKSLHPDMSMIGLAYPNPLSESTTIPFMVSERMQVQISLYDLTGRKVKDMVNEMRDPGFYTAQWDRTDQAGTRVANGMYIYRMNNAGSKADKMNKIIVK